jgi:hypothetical protein
LKGADALVMFLAPFSLLRLACLVTDSQEAATTKECNALYVAVLDLQQVLSA